MSKKGINGFLEDIQKGLDEALSQGDASRYYIRCLSLGLKESDLKDNEEKINLYREGKKIYGESVKYRKEIEDRVVPLKSLDSFVRAISNEVEKKQNVRVKFSYETGAFVPGLGMDLTRVYEMGNYSFKMKGGRYDDWNEVIEDGLKDTREALKNSLKAFSFDIREFGDSLEISKSR